MKTAYYAIVVLILFLSPQAFAKTVNVRSNALVMLARGFEVAGEFNLGRGFALGPSLLAFRYEGTETPPIKNEAGGLGVRIVYYMSAEAFTESWLFALTSYSISNKVSQGAFSATVPTSASTLTAGYQWVWESGFNLTLAGGLISSAAPSSAELKDSSGATSVIPLPGNAVNFHPEFSIGWAF